MQFYVLTALVIVGIFFLVTIAVQLFKIEKSVFLVTELAEHRIRKMYQKG